MPRTPEKIAASAMRRYNKCKEYTKLYHKTEKGIAARKEATARYSASLTPEFKKERERRYYLVKKEKLRLKAIGKQVAEQAAAQAAKKQPSN